MVNISPLSPRGHRGWGAGRFILVHTLVGSKRGSRVTRVWSDLSHRSVPTIYGQVGQGYLCQRMIWELLKDVCPILSMWTVCPCTTPNNSCHQKPPTLTAPHLPDTHLFNSNFKINVKWYVRIILSPPIRINHSYMFWLYQQQKI